MLATMEGRLKSLWAQILQVEESSVQNDDHFFEAGGESVEIFVPAVLHSSNSETIAL